MRFNLDLRKIHIAMWIGLAINLGYSMVPVDIGELAKTLDVAIESQEMEDQIMSMTNMFRFGFLFFQVMGIFLFFMNPRAGLIVSLCASVPTFLNSCVYIFGAVFTYYRFRFQAFGQRPDVQEFTGMSYANFRSSMLLKNSLILFGASLFVVIVLPSPITAFFALISMFIAVVLLVVGVRLKWMPALAFFKSGLTVVPHIMAYPVYIPYDTMRAATLLASNAVQFQVVMDNGMHMVVLPLQYIRPEDRKNAVAQIAETLQAHDIQLY